MILGRFAKAIRKQDWAAVTIEFLIVVIGLFVGLQVDDWNQRRNDRILEQEYLRRLSNDTQANIDNFRDLESVFESKAAFIRSLLDTPAEELMQAGRIEFLQSLNYSTYIALPAVTTATFSELESSGRLSLLRDVELRGELSRSYANYRLMQEILDEPSGDYRRLLFEAIPGGAYLDWRIANDPDYDAIAAALSQLQVDDRFVSTANAEIAYATELITWLQFHRQWEEEILAIIDRPDAK